VTGHPLKLTTGEFWDFSVRAYGSSDVPEACLTLQNQYGVDVNMLLFSVWCGYTRGPFEEQTLISAVEFSKQWSEHIVCNLREARTWMKQDGCQMESVERDACLSLRTNIKAVELAAEKLQEFALEQIAMAQSAKNLTTSEKVTAGINNVSRYMDRAVLRLDSQAWSHVGVIMLAGDSDLSRQDWLKAKPV